MGGLIQSEIYGWSSRNIIYSDIFIQCYYPKSYLQYLFLVIIVTIFYNLIKPGVKVEKIALSALDHVLACTVIDGKISIRGYTVAFKKSGSRVPLVDLVPMGPYWNLTVRRSVLASEDLWKTALKQPKIATVKKIKNISENSMGDKIGRIHMDKQDFDKMAVRKVAVLRDRKKKK